MSQADNRRTASFGCLILGAVLILTVVTVAAFQLRPWQSSLEMEMDSAKDQSEASTKARNFPLPPISTSPFQNTRADVKYVGSEVCQSCHQEEHETYLHTGMARSMASVDLAREPADGQFVHTLSKRRFQVTRRDGRMWHRELLLTDGPEEVVLAEFPVKYVTGSGRHSLTYLVETDGFLVESPITWYRSRDGWGMSPGYDRAQHSGFQREIGESCLICHAGQAKAIDGSMHRMRIIEETIGCERCHGPGELHVEKRSLAATDPGESEDQVDHTIVNPRHLTRQLAEAVCQQCHLRGNATVVSRGRNIDDYRPGLPLEDFRQDYWLDSAEKEMTVVGHVEQMHLSACYQGSDRFTCSSCHSPHGEPPPEQRIAHYRAACLTCHAPEHCQVDPALLAKESAENDCTHCHMPTSDTDIPHLAFTHHRVGIHDLAARQDHGEGSGSAEAEAAIGVLKPFFDFSRLSEIDQQRSLGLAYLELAMHQETRESTTHYQKEAFRLLTEVHDAGLTDSVADSALASLRFDFGLDGVAPLAQRVLQSNHLRGLERSNALFLIADDHYRQRRYPEAIMTLQELSTVRRNALQWMLRAQCEQALEHEPGVVESLLTAVSINPRNPTAHRFLANHFRKAGNASRAEWHERLARELP